MYRSIGKCKNYRTDKIEGNADCRKCSNNANKALNAFKVGDWCKNYTTKHEIKGSVITKDKPKLITMKDFKARRV